MSTQISVPIPTGQFLELVDFLREQGDDRDPVAAVSDAVDYWLNNAGWKPELVSRPNPDSRGYSWKSLFLPHGTEIRMRYKGEYHYATVNGDEVLYEGNPVTPAVLANTITQSSRNAWRDLWIKRPGDREWNLAEDLRNPPPPVNTEEILASFK